LPLRVADKSGRRAGLGRELPMPQPAKASATRAPETQVPDTQVPDTGVRDTRMPDTDLPEPSIEEILATIRRSIVPDDDADKPPVAATRKPGSRKPGARSRRTDGETVGAAADAAPGRGADKAAEHRLDDAPEPAAQVGPGEEARAAQIAPDQGWEDENPAPSHPADAVPLLSPRTTAAMDTAFDSLAHTMLSQNPRTLEDLVCEMLKPMLKSWLDANLPDMVERLVRAEIERVSRGPRRR
jgi:uncharacterized protein